jgi:hypothetical protein
VIPVKNGIRLHLLLYNCLSVHPTYGCTSRPSLVLLQVQDCNKTGLTILVRVVTCI